MRYTYNEDLFYVDSAEKYYLIGFILADGYIGANLSRFEIGLAEKDKDFLELLKNMICPSKTLKYKENQKAYRVNFDNKNIVKEIMKFVSNREKSKSLMFPYDIPEKYLLDFIRGYSDGDGNISVKRGQKKVNGEIKYYYGLRYRILGQRDFLEGLQYNLQRLGLARNAVNVHKKGIENVYYIEYGFAVAERILEAMYHSSTLKLERKFQVYKAISKADSVQLGSLYNTKEGHYNTCGVDKISTKV